MGIFQAAGTLKDLNCLTRACTKAADSSQGAGVTQGIRKQNKMDRWRKMKFSYCSGALTDDLAGLLMAADGDGV